MRCFFLIEVCAVAAASALWLFDSYEKTRPGLFHRLAGCIPKPNQAIYVRWSVIGVNGKTYIVGRDMITTRERMARYFASQGITVRDQGVLISTCGVVIDSRLRVFFPQA